MNANTVTLITNALPIALSTFVVILNHFHVKNATAIAASANQAAADALAATHGKFLDSLPQLVRDAMAIENAATTAAPATK